MRTSANYIPRANRNRSQDNEARDNSNNNHYVNISGHYINNINTNTGDIDYIHNHNSIRNVNRNTMRRNEDVDRPRHHHIGLHIGRRRINSPLQLANVAVANLADEMDYNVEQRNGQRIFGPPRNWNGPAPSLRCEVFVAGIPHETYEDFIIPLLRIPGYLYQFRLMMDFSGYNRGFGFAMYTSREEATEACRLLNNFPIYPFSQLGVMLSNDNTCLYIGGIPNMTPLLIMYQIFRETIGAKSIKITKVDVNERHHVVVQYRTHRDAALARRFMLMTHYQMWNTRNHIIVDWAIRHYAFEPCFLEATRQHNGEILLSGFPILDSEFDV